MAEATHVLAHVRQRLDALTYDGHSQYLLSSLPVVSTFQPPVVQTSRRRRSLCNAVLWYTGLTSFYFRLVLLLGTGWFLAIVGTSTYWYALPAAQTDLALIYTPAQVIVLLGVNFLGGGLGCILAGVTADHYGRRPIFLTALCFWLVMNALTADAWNYASLLTFRLVAGVGIGGQLPILAILALEYSPTRTRGTVTVLSVSFAGVGVVATVLYGQLLTTEKGLRWRLMHLVLSALALTVVPLFFVALKESPKYLASIGQTDEALCALTAIESAHGISRPVRVMVPTSLYEPPSQRPLVTYDRYPDSLDSMSNVDHEAPHETRPSTCHLDGRHASRCSRRVCVATVPRLMDEWTLQSDPFGLSAYHFSFDAHASFRSALTHQLVVLGSPPMARRTGVIWFFWFAELCCFSGAIMTTLSMARTFLQTTTKSMEFHLIDQLVWSLLLFSGCLMTAGMIEWLGRRVALGLFVAGSGTVMLTCAWVLHEDGQWIQFSVALGAMMVTTGGTLGALLPLTSEQFPLVTRALGISSTIAWGHFGTFTGVYFVLRHVMDDSPWTWQQSRWTLAICGMVVLGLFPLIFLMGPETRGCDIDAFELQEAQEGVASPTRELSLASTGVLDVRNKQLDMNIEKEASVHSWQSKLRLSRKGGCRETQRELLQTQFDELATLDMEHKLHQRSSIEDKPSSRFSVLEILEPILMDWRTSCSSLYSDFDLPYSVNDETERYTIDLDMFDTFTYISTPVLGGDDRADHEQRTNSRVSVGSNGQ